MTDELRFTDDELISMALDVEAPIPVVVPTVDVTDDDAVAAAAVRGQRSLYVRGLVGPDDVDPIVVRVQRALSAPSRFTTFAGNESLDRVVALPASTWFPVSEELWRIQEGALGTYVFRDDHLAAVRDEVVDWFEVARTADPAPVQDGGVELWICLVSVTSAGVVGIAARGGQLRLTTVAPGQTPSVEVRRSEDAPALVQQILDRSMSVGAGS